MAKSKSPAFQFYPSDWLSSTSISLMSPAEEGAYIRLLCHAWSSPDCGIPDDEKLLAELSRLRKKWPQSSARIRAKFDSIGGRMFNTRLLEERAKQIEWKEKSSKGGSLSAATKAQAKLKGGCDLVDDCLQPKPQPNLNSSSSSSSSTTNYLPKGYEFPKTAAAICGRYASTDWRFVSQVIQASAQAFISIDQPKIPSPDDSTYAAAVEEATSRTQTSAGLYLKSVPLVISNWAKHGRNGGESGPDTMDGYRRL